MSDPQSSPNHSNQDRLRERVRLRQKRKTTSCWPCRDRKVKVLNFLVYISPFVYVANYLPLNIENSDLKALTLNPSIFRMFTDSEILISSVKNHSHVKCVKRGDILTYAYTRVQMDKTGLSIRRLSRKLEAAHHARRPPPESSQALGFLSVSMRKCLVRMSETYLENLSWGTTPFPPSRLNNPVTQSEQVRGTMSKLDLCR